MEKKHLKLLIIILSIIICCLYLYVDKTLFDDGYYDITIISEPDIEEIYYDKNGNIVGSYSKSGDRFDYTDIYLIVIIMIPFLVTTINLIGILKKNYSFSKKSIIFTITLSIILIFDKLFEYFIHSIDVYGSGVSFVNNIDLLGSFLLVLECNLYSRFNKLIKEET